MAATGLTVPGWGQIVAARPLTLAIASLSFGAAAIHFGVAPDHFAEYTLYGVFFAFLGWFQVVWASAYLLRPDARLGLLGAVANAAVVGVWIYSRTIGLPIGPNPGSTEVLGVADSISSAFELLIAVGVIAELTFLSGVEAQSPRRAAAVAVIGVALVMAATVIALVNLAPSASMG